MRQKDDWGDWDELTVAEKLDRMRRMWEDLAAADDAAGIPDAQRDELERRLQEHERTPGSYPTWEEVRRELERRR